MFKPLRVIGAAGMAAVVFMGVGCFSPTASSLVNAAKAENANVSPELQKAADDEAAAKAAGNVISVDEAVDGKADVTVSLAKPGFVTVYAEVSGEPGPLVGQSEILPASVDQKLSVPFTAKDGASYFAMLRGDDDGSGTLDENVDNPINQPNGDTVMEEFVYHAE